MCYNTKVLPDMVNDTRQLVVHNSYSGTEHCKALVSLIGYLKGKETKSILIRKTKVLEAVLFCDYNYAKE